ncbi:MAG: hypothetical protein QOH03_1013 [Kribbellaceae bacterium]|nr:hypothetical protein [Kribbellaceae bacterium]
MSADDNDLGEAGLYASKPRPGEPRPGEAGTGESRIGEPRVAEPTADAEGGSGHGVPGGAQGATAGARGTGGAAAHAVKGGAREGVVGVAGVQAGGSRGGGLRSGWSGGELGAEVNPTEIRVRYPERIAEGWQQRRRRE